MTYVVPARPVLKIRYRVAKWKYYILASISHALTKPCLESQP